MPLLSTNKNLAVQGFVLKLVNNNCPELQALREGPRLEGRANLTIVVRVVPVEGERILARQAFSAVTKEFSTMGVALVLQEPRGLDEAMLGFRWRGSLTWIRAKAKHLNPMGGGFYQLGFRMIEKLNASDHPELQAICI